MIGLIQRVSGANVAIDRHKIAAIGTGLLVLVGVEREDTPANAQKLADRLVAYRVFADAAGKMNRSVRDVGGALLLVPQFTLAADTGKGLRPGFSTAAAPEQAQALFLHVVAQAQCVHAPVAQGEFGADMQVTLTNDGPVTFRLQMGA